jgi:acylpyruvate hydrolase
MHSDHLPLAYRTVYGIGRNYADHAKELGNPAPKSLVVFLKPLSAIAEAGQNIVLPQHSTQVHHEVECVVLIGKKGKNIPETDALGFVHSYTVGLDLTARDLQDQAKKAGLPWAISKGFDTSAVLGNWVSSGEILKPEGLALTLEVNGERRQVGVLSEMIFSVPRLIADLSRLFTLYPGDVIYTGTPAGVAALRSGDQVLARLWEGAPDSGREVSRIQVSCESESL